MKGMVQQTVQTGRRFSLVCSGTYLGSRIQALQQQALLVSQKVSVSESAMRFGLDDGVGDGCSGGFDSQLGDGLGGTLLRWAGRGCEEGFEVYGGTGWRNGAEADDDGDDQLPKSKEAFTVDRAPEACGVC